MTTLYRPILIESAEQAEALPDGTVASRDYYDEGYGYHHYDCARKAEGGSWIQIGTLDDYESALVLGWTALVPIEAEEEWAAEFDSGEMYMNLDQDSARNADGGAAKSRLVTPWEET